MKKHKLSQCQKTCLLKCASSEILKYKGNLKTKYGSVKTVYDCEEGVCTEFSRVFDDLAYQFGIKSRKVDSLTMHHSFNKVQIDDEWVYLEPQDSSCEFYTQDPKLFTRDRIDFSERYYIEKQENLIMPADKTNVKKFGVPQ